MQRLAQAIRSAALTEGAAAGLVVLVLSALVYLPSLNNPSHPFWDEYYYLPAVERHVEGTATYASHPPLGFMLMAAGKRVAGGDTAQDHPLATFAKITDATAPTGYDYRAIRLSSAIFAIAGCVLFYGLLLRLTGSAFSALAFVTPFVFENAFIVQFRSAHLDAFQIAFVLAALQVWLRNPDVDKSWRDFAWFGALLGLAVSVKTNAAVLLVLPTFAVAADIWRTRQLQRAAIHAGAGAGAFTAVVLAVLTLNIALSPHAPDIFSEQGRHELRYMGPAYQDYLNGRTALSFSAWQEAITGYAAFMRDDFAGVTLNDRNGQAPATWPIYTKTVVYRWDSSGERTSYTLMFGNPIGWRLSLLGVIAGIVLAVLRRRRPAGWGADFNCDFARLESVIVMYAVFLAAHIYMGTFRVMYVYHHFIGLILGFIALALVFKILDRSIPRLAQHKTVILSTLCLVVACGFWFEAPLSYHRPLTKAGCEMRGLEGPAFHCIGK